MLRMQTTLKKEVRINNQQNNTSSLPDALYDFVSIYTIPQISPQNIIHADQNNSSLPSGEEEYIVITIINVVSHGTPVEEYQDGSISVTTLYEYFIQIDFFSNGDNARKRAISLANIGRSSLAPEFFNQRGMSVTTVSDPQDVTFVGDANQYVKRWMFTIQVTRPEVNLLPIETANSVELSIDSTSQSHNHETKPPTSYFEDVDVHHKP